MPRRDVEVAIGARADLEELEQLEENLRDIALINEQVSANLVEANNAQLRSLNKLVRGYKAAEKALSENEGTAGDVEKAYGRLSDAMERLNTQANTTRGGRLDEDLKATERIEQARKEAIISEQKQRLKLAVAQETADNAALARSRKNTERRIHQINTISARNEELHSDDEKALQQVTQQRRRDIAQARRELAVQERLTKARIEASQANQREAAGSLRSISEREGIRAERAIALARQRNLNVAKRTEREIADARERNERTIAAMRARAARRSEAGEQGMFGSFTKAGLALVSIVAVARAIRGLVQTISGMVLKTSQLRQELDTLKRGFVSLNRGGLLESNKMLNDLRKATLGAVSRLDLLRVANLALNTGIRSLGGGLREMLGNIRRVSLALGRDMVEDIERVIKGGGKLETELLDELGIVTRATEAYEKYARALGRTVRSLNQVERAEAFNINLQEELAEKGERLGEVMNFHAHMLGVLRVEWQELMFILGDVSTVALVKVTERFTDLTTAIRGTFGALHENAASAGMPQLAAIMENEQGVKSLERMRALMESSLQDQQEQFRDYATPSSGTVDNVVGFLRSPFRGGVHREPYPGIDRIADELRQLGEVNISDPAGVVELIDKLTGSIEKKIIEVVQQPESIERDASLDTFNSVLSDLRRFGDDIRAFAVTIDTLTKKGDFNPDAPDPLPALLAAFQEQSDAARAFTNELVRDVTEARQRGTAFQELSGFLERFGEGREREKDLFELIKTIQKPVEEGGGGDLEAGRGLIKGMNIITARLHTAMLGLINATQAGPSIDRAEVGTDAAVLDSNITNILKDFDAHKSIAKLADSMDIDVGELSSNAADMVDILVSEFVDNIKRELTDKEFIDPATGRLIRQQITNAIAEGDFAGARRELSGLQLLSSQGVQRRESEGRQLVLEADRARDLGHISEEVFNEMLSILTTTKTESKVLFEELKALGIRIRKAEEREDRQPKEKDTFKPLVRDARELSTAFIGLGRTLLDSNNAFLMLADTLSRSNLAKTVEQNLVSGKGALEGVSYLQAISLGIGVLTTIIRQGQEEERRVREAQSQAVATTNSILSAMPKQLDELFRAKLRPIVEATEGRISGITNVEDLFAEIKRILNFRPKAATRKVEDIDVNFLRRLVDAHDHVLRELVTNIKALFPGGTPFGEVLSKSLQLSEAFQRIIDAANGVTEANKQEIRDRYELERTRAIGESVDVFRSGTPHERQEALVKLQQTLASIRASMEAELANAGGAERSGIVFPDFTPTDFTVPEGILDLIAGPAGKANPADAANELSEWFKRVFELLEIEDSPLLQNKVIEFLKNVPGDIRNLSGRVLWDLASIVGIDFHTLANGLSAELYELFQNAPADLDLLLKVNVDEDLIPPEIIDIGKIVELLDSNNLIPEGARDIIIDALEQAKLEFQTQSLGEPEIIDIGKIVELLDSNNLIPEGARDIIIDALEQVKLLFETQALGEPKVFDIGAAIDVIDSNLQLQNRAHILVDDTFALSVLFTLRSKCIVYASLFSTLSVLFTLRSSQRYVYDVGASVDVIDSNLQLQNRTHILTDRTFQNALSVLFTLRSSQRYVYDVGASVDVIDSNLQLQNRTHILVDDTFQNALSVLFTLRSSQRYVYDVGASVDVIDSNLQLQNRTHILTDRTFQNALSALFTLRSSQRYVYDMGASVRVMDSNRQLQQRTHGLVDSVLATAVRHVQLLRSNQPYLLNIGNMISISSGSLRSRIESAINSAVSSAISSHEISVRRELEGERSAPDRSFTPDYS